MSRCGGALVVLALGLGWAKPAAAEPGVASPAGDEGWDGGGAPVKPREHWYGWQTLTADGAATGMAMGAIATTGDTSASFWAIGAGTFALGAPIIHLAHERPLLALGDLALRVGVPFISLFVGGQFLKLNPCPDAAAPDRVSRPSATPCGQTDDTPLIVGGLAGAAAVSALDAAVFSYEPTKPERPRYLEAPKPRWFANALITSHGARVAIAARF